MALFIGHCGRNICYVGSSKPIESSFSILPLLDILEINSFNINLKDLITKFEVRRQKVVPIDFKNNHKHLRVAFIGVYKIACGIATYSEWLWSEMIPLVGEYRIFAENASLEVLEEPNVIRCWKRGEPFVDLIKNIREYDPDVIYIQHEWGIFPIGTHFLSLMTALQQYRTIVTLHSVYSHLDKLTNEAAMPEMIVHTNQAKDMLVNIKKVSKPVHVIPHGGFPCTSMHRYWNRYGSKHLLLQFGFGFKYKGWETSLNIVAQLKEKFPDIFFTGLISENGHNKKFHDEYFHELMELSKSLDIEQNVGLIRGFQSDEVLDSFIRTNTVAIFPYIRNGNHEVFGCSGAARLAMSKAIPVVVSDVPLFDDLEGVCFRSENVSGFCSEIEKLFDQKYKEKQIEKQNIFLEENSWEVSAKRYLEIL